MSPKHFLVAAAANYHGYSFIIALGDSFTFSNFIVGFCSCYLLALVLLRCLLVSPLSQLQNTRANSPESPSTGTLSEQHRALHFELREAGFWEGIQASIVRKSLHSFGHRRSSLIHSVSDPFKELLPSPGSRSFQVFRFFFFKILKLSVQSGRSRRNWIHV
jgi:hypothetical protein